MFKQVVGIVTAVLWKTERDKTSIRGSCVLLGSPSLRHVAVIDVPASSSLRAVVRVVRISSFTIPSDISYGCRSSVSIVAGLLAGRLYTRG